MAKKGGAPTKSEILAYIADQNELSRKQVAGVFESLNTVMRKSLRGNGEFTLPGLMKLRVVKKPATKQREGVNPFTGEKMVFKAKPASKKVRALPLKQLKEMVNEALALAAHPAGAGCAARPPQRPLRVLRPADPRLPGPPADRQTQSPPP